MSRNIVLKVAYDGAEFFGWQKTNSGPSIEEAILRPLTQILQHEIVLQAASRTDRGVHAEGQIVNFFTEKNLDLWRLKGSLNSLLPSSIRILEIKEMPLHFHPSLDVKTKEYHYQIFTGKILLPVLRYTHWHIPFPFDFHKISLAASHLIGEHDFTSFCNQAEDGKNHIRKIEKISSESKSPEHLRFIVKGNHFLYKMVRNLIGTLVYVGIGKIKPESLPEILECRSRVYSGMTAPAYGLTLKQINY